MQNLTDTDALQSRYRSHVSDNGFPALVLATLVLVVPLAQGGMLTSVQAAHTVIIALLLMHQASRLAFFRAAGSTNSKAWLALWGTLSAYLLFQLIVKGPIFNDAGTLALNRAQEAPRFGLLPLATDPGKTLQYWTAFTVYWTTAWLVASLSWRHIRWVVCALVALATFEATYGLLAHAWGQQTILGLWPKIHYKADATGTFVNRNHFAGMLAVCWPLGIAFLFAPRNQGGLGLAQPLRHGATLLFAVVVGVAIVNSHSRLGVVAALFGLLAWLWSMGRTDVYRRDRVLHWAPWVILGLVFTASLWFGPVALVKRFLALPDDTGRFEIWTALFDLPASVWLFGVGADAFADVYPLVQAGTRQATSLYAHNDWLQFVLELGVFGFILVATAAWYWIKRAKPSDASIVQLGALAGVLAMALHSLGDFNLHTRGSALVFWTAVGIVMNPDMGLRRRKRRR